MDSGAGPKFDFFLSRRGSVAALAREVADVLSERGYKVLVQDYDIPYGSSFVEAMHEAVKTSRDLLILFSKDYENSPYTRKEFTSFEAERLRDADGRHIIILRCEDTPLQGLLADNVYQDLVGVDDPVERKRRIIAAAERQSQAAGPPPRPFVNVPPRMAGFAGRFDELAKIDAILLQGKAAAVVQSSSRVAIQGLGGIGKTALAAEYAYRFRKFYGGVIWCRAESRMALVESLGALARELDILPRDCGDGGDAARRALDRLSLQRSMWLLIYDNVAAPDEIADLLPSSGAHLLITSRFPDWNEWAEEIQLDVLPTADAIDFLQARADRKDREGAAILATALGCLPLALDHAAATCRRAGVSFADYAARASDFMATAPRGTAYPRSVSATFDLAIRQAATTPQAELAMMVLACCGPERIPIAVVDRAIPDPLERFAAITSLAEVSLLRHDPFPDGAPAVSIHRLVRAIARSRSRSVGAEKECLGRVLAGIDALYPQESNLDPSAADEDRARLTPHALAALEFWRSQGDPEKFASLKERVRSFLERRVRSLVGSGGIGAAEELLLGLINDAGQSGLVYAMLGQVHRSAWDEAKRRHDPLLARAALERAISAYLMSFEADRKDYLPALHAVVLMVLANPTDDRIVSLAREASTIVELGSSSDYWNLATLVELAVVARDYEKAMDALPALCGSASEPWQPGITWQNIQLMAHAFEAAGEDGSIPREIVRRLKAEERALRGGPDT